MRSRHWEPYLRAFADEAEYGNGMRIWEPADRVGEGGVAQGLARAGFEVICTGLPETDFLACKEPMGDIVITNPPYGLRLREKFLSKLYGWGIPWAMLMLLTSLEGLGRGKLWQKYGCELLVYDDRIDFTPIPDPIPTDRQLVEEAKQPARKMSVPWFNASWFCHGLLPEKLMFSHLVRR